MNGRVSKGKQILIIYNIEATSETKKQDRTSHFFFTSFLFFSSLFFWNY